MTHIEIVAAVFGFLSVAYYIVRSPWSWPAGLISVLLYISVFWESKLYADMILHCIYVVLQLYGWWAWARSANVEEGQSTAAVRVRTLSPGGNLLCVLITGVMASLFALALKRWTDAASPIPDSFVAATSLVAQLLLANRYLENWIYWIAVDTVAVFLFANRELYTTAILYGLFWCMAIAGLVTWFRAKASQS